MQHRTCPSSILSAESDVDAACEMAFGVLGCITHVEDLCARISHAKDLVQVNGLENLLQILVERGVFASVENGVVSEIRWSVGLVGCDQKNKLLLRHGLQGVIQAPLVSE